MGLKEDITIIKQMKANDIFKKYIEHIRYPKFRNLEPNTRINFDFPLTFLVGKNGGGIEKSASSGPILYTATTFSLGERSLWGGSSVAGLGVRWYIHGAFFRIERRVRCEQDPVAGVIFQAADRRLLGAEDGGVRIEILEIFGVRFLKTVLGRPVFITRRARRAVAQEMPAGSGAARMERVEST